MKNLTPQEAEIWQAAQLEIINQLLDLLPTVDIEGLLKDWQKVLRDREQIDHLSQQDKQGTTDLNEEVLSKSELQAAKDAMDAELFEHKQDKPKGAKGKR